MERITPSGSPDLSRSKGRREKIEKKKKGSGVFLEALEKAGTSDSLHEINMEVPLAEDLSLEEMLDDIHECGQRLKDSPSLAHVMEYKQAVRNFMHHVVTAGLAAETREGARFNPLKKQKRFTIIKIIDEKLERLAAGILQNQKSRLDFLNSIDEINGLLVDLVG